MTSFPLPFAKYEALRNDFLLIDARVQPDLAGDWLLARALLDRHFGAGADDAIFVLTSEVADVRMRIRTPGGGWLSMCGNGIRCVARFVWDTGISTANPLCVETDAGVREVRRLDDGLIEADLLAPELRAAAIPTTLAERDGRVLDRPLDLGPAGKIRVSCVSVGNPHAIFFTDEIDAVDVTVLGPLIERHIAFPEGVNVHAAQVLAPGRARIRTWERGAGLTLA